MADQPSADNSGNASFADTRDILLRKRARQKGKTNSGCLPCRRRKKKCDETKPCCKHCLSQRIECKWPQRAIPKYYGLDTKTEHAGRTQRSTEGEPAITSGTQQYDDGSTPLAEPRSHPHPQPQQQQQDIATTHPDAGTQETQADTTSNHIQGRNPAQAASEPQMPHTKQPLDHSNAGTANQQKEDNHAECTVQVDCNVEHMDGGREQAPGSSQTEPQRMDRKGHPRRISSTTVERLHGPEAGQSLLQAGSQGKTALLDQVQEGFHVFDARPNTERQIQPKRPPFQHKPPLQVRTQQALYPSQYDNLAWNSRLQSLPHHHHHHHPQAPTSHPAQFSPPSNKAKMTRGQMYDHSDPELVYDRTRCRFLLSRFNSNGGASTEDRRQLAKSFLGSIGEGSEIEAPFRCEYGYNIKIGKGTHIGPECLIDDPSIVSIGSKCVIGPRVIICCKKSSPNLNDHDGSRSLFYGPGIWIEDRVCIEAGVIIHAGVRIGTGSTIAAGSVVTKSIRERSLAGGNPATTFQYV